MQAVRRARSTFLVAWAVLVLVRWALAAHVPLFVDEAFYWQEGRHPAWAYSDLPGLTAWLIGLGTHLAGDSLLGVRWPFLLMVMAMPWLAVRAAWTLGPARAWQAGTLVTLFPLLLPLGVLALPDVPMNLATVMCLLGGVLALHKADWKASFWLALGLVVGGLSHYRFLGVIAVGMMALLCLPQGRQALRNPRIWLAIGLGLLAWMPLIVWNLQHGEAGWRFQLLDRHPWRLQAAGLWFPLIQAALATPLLWLAMLVAATRAGSRWPLSVRWFALCGGLTVLGYFLLGFVADTQRVSFHWPLPGYLALLVLVPGVLAAWSAWARTAAILVLGLGLLTAMGAATWIGIPAARSILAGSSHYPENFAGWDELAQAVRTRLDAMPAGTRVIVDQFKLGAELGFALGDADIPVLEHPLNDRHGRSRQLQLWGLLQAANEAGHWRLLVVADSDMGANIRANHYQSLCQRLGAFPAPEVVEVDQGARRFLLFALPPGRSEDPCEVPVSLRPDTSADIAVHNKPLSTQAFGTWHE